LPATRARIDHNGLLPELQHDHRQRYRYKLGRQAGLAQGGLGLLNTGIPDEAGIVGLLPDAIVKRGHLDRPDLIFVEPQARVGGRLRVGRRDPGQWLVKSKRNGEGRCAQQLAA
jgi:hypothetical protein